jgi:hypothetical protein
LMEGPEPWPRVCSRIRHYRILCFAISESPHD